MASSSNSRKSYHVFLSFRGPDVRNTFLSHLYKALDQSGIYTYMDSEELRKGEEITSELIKAIKDSRIAVIIFSKDYPSSSWCLDELTNIMECKMQKDLIVLPVFYKVEPREVRTPRGIYREAMAKHAVKFRNDPEKIKRWNEALLNAGNLSGWEFADGCEAELVQVIVHEISTQLDRTSLNVAKFPVGIESRVQEIKKILNLHSKDDVSMVGLWGQGGVGKTTIAKAIYNVIFRDFQGSCFLDRVRENSTNLVHLQKILLLKVLGKKSKVFSVDEGIHLIQERLCNKRVLIILDDVDEQCQLDALVGDVAWFGKGSRIVITTRNKHLLTICDVDSDHLYKVKALEDGEAFELFRKHAFLGNQIRSDLVDNILHSARGLPLALVVLGSFLRGRREHEWESVLQNLDKRPEKDINNVLKVSYDQLDDRAKEIFLDIACFFKGQKTEYIKKVLNSFDFDPTIWIQILIECSLISEEYGTLQMHDLIQLMGRDIVEEKCRDDPGKRSRLWLYDDVLDVLSGDAGTNAVKAIVLKLPEPKEMHIGPNAFTNVKKLRLLILHNVRNPFLGPIHLPKELRWFEWPNCASVPEFSDCAKKLVGLELQNTKIEGLLKDFKELKNLKFIDLSKCQSLVCMPDLSCTPNLEELDLSWCKNLERAHDSFAYHHRLRLLNLIGCSKLQRFPDIQNKNKSLQEVSLQRTEEFPTPTKDLVSLEKMYIFDCKKITICSSSIYKLQNLESLQLKGCPELMKFPKEEEDLKEPHIETGFPMLSGNNFTKLPTWEKIYSLNSYCHSCFQRPIPSNICDIEDVELYSSGELVHKGFPKLEKFHRKTNCRIILPGGEMPKWLLPNKEGYISFVASKDLYKKILGVAFCVVFQVETRMCSIATRCFNFELIGYVNCKGIKHRRTVWPFHLDRVWHEYIESKDFYLDHMLLEYMESKDLWPIDHFGPDDSSDFYFGIRTCNSECDTRNEGLVKNCGFRLICKPLENDLEVLLQDNKLLDPALFCEVLHGDNSMSIKEESSSKTKDLQDCKWCRKHKGLNIADISIERHRYSSFWSHYRNVIPGREMPKGFVLIEDGTISFKASQDLYNQFIGLYLCVVFGVEDGEKEVSFDITPCVNGQRRNELSGTLGSFDMDHVWFQLFTPNALWGLLEGEVEFGQFNKSYLRFILNIRVAGATVKKMGYVMQSYPLDDALKVELEKNPLMDPASFLEHYENPLYYGSRGWEDLCKRLEDMHGGRDSIY